MRLPKRKKETGRPGRKGDRLFREEGQHSKTRRMRSMNSPPLPFACGKRRAVPLLL